MTHPNKRFKFNVIAMAVVSALSLLATERANAQLTANGGCDTYTPTTTGQTVTCSTSGSNPDEKGVQTPEDNKTINNVTVTVQNGVVFDVNGSNIGLGAGTTVDNSGTLYTQKFRYGYGMSAGVNGRSTAGGNTFTNQTSGIVLTDGADAHGMYVNARQAGAASNSITNRGSVTTTGDRSDGIRLYTESTTAEDSIENIGSITTSGEDASGIHVQNTKTVTEITNSGTITSTNADSPGYGIYIEGAANVINSGTITADPTGYAIYVKDNGNTNANTVTLQRGSDITGALQFSATRNEEKLVFEGISSSTTPFAFNNEVTGLNAIEVTAGTFVTMGASAYDLVDGEITVGTSAILAVTGDISGSGGLVVNGSGYLRLSGSNTYTGDTTLNSGILSVESSTAVSSGTIIVKAGLGTGLLVSGEVTVGNAVQIGASIDPELTGILYAVPSGFLDQVPPTPGADPELTVMSGDITLNQSLGLASVQEFELSGAIDATSGGTQRLGVFGLGTGGVVRLSGGVGQTNPLGQVLTEGEVELASNISTTGSQEYGNKVTLGSDVTLEGQDISATDTIDGAYGLTITDTGITSLANVGETTALSSITVTSKSLALSDVSTTGAQIYTTTGTRADGLIETNSTYTSVGGAITFDGAVQANDELIVDTTNAGEDPTGANVTFESTLDSEADEANAVTITAGTSGIITFKDAVGATTSLASLTSNSGVTNIDGGSVTTTGAQTYLDQVNLGAATTLTVAGLSAQAINMSTFGLTVEETGTGEIEGVISGASAFAKTGSGTLTLSGANTYSGGTTVNGGTLKLGNAGSVPTSALAVGADGTFDLNNFAQTVTDLSGAGDITLGSATLTAGSTADTTFSGVISGGGNLTKTGTGTLTLSGANTYTGITTINGGGVLKMGADNVLSSQTLVTINSGTLDLADTDQTIGGLEGSGNVTLGSGTLTTGNSNMDRTYGGVMSGTGGLVKVGTGTFTLTGANTYSGGTTVDGGVLQVGAAGAVPTGTLAVGADGTFDLNNYNQTVTDLTGAGDITLGSATLTAGATTDMAFSGVISGTGGLTKDGSGTLTLSGVNTYKGATTVSDGTLQMGIANAVATGALEVQSGAAFDLNNFAQTVTDLTGAGDITLGSATLTAGATADTTFSGVISGTGGLTKDGSGTLTLSGVNTYTGTTTVSDGTLKLGVASALVAGALVVQSDATFDLNNFAQTVTDLSGAGDITLGSATLTAGSTANTTFSGVISGKGGLTKAGTGTLTLSGLNTYTGATTVSDGTLQMGVASALTVTALEVLSGATFDLNNVNQTVTDLSGAGGVTLGSATLTAGSSSDTDFSGVISGTGGLTKDGSGTLTLSGVNTYTGATTVSDGTLQLGVASALAAGALDVQSGATFDLNNFAQKVTDLTGAGDITLGSATLTAGSTADTTFSGVISGSGGLTKDGSGTLTLSGGNTYTGATTVSDGILQMGIAKAVATGALEVQSGATFDLNSFNHTVTDLSGAGDITLGSATLTAGAKASTTFSGVISGSGGLTKDGAGTLTLSGANTYTGITTINSVLKMGADNVLSSQTLVTINKKGGLNLAGTDQTIGGLEGSGNVTLSSGTLSTGANNSSTSYSGAISGTGGLVKVGSGTLTLSGANTYSGGTTVNGGVLRVGAAGAVPTGTLAVGADGTFDLNNFNQTVTDLTGAGSITLGSATLTAGATADTTFSGVISGTGGLTKDGLGTLTFSGVNTYSGGTAINQGTLQLGASGAVPSGSLSVASDSTFDLNGFNQTVTSLSGSGFVALGSGVLTTGSATDGMFSGVISGTGSLIKKGTGVLTLSGLSSYSGGTTVSAGVLALATGSSVGSGSIALSNGSTLQANAPMTLANAMVLAGDSTIATGSNDVVASGVVSGSGRLIKTGSSTLTLSGANTYGGGTELQAGTLVAATDQALGTGALIAQGEDVVLQAGKADLMLANAVDLNADLIIDTAGEVVLFNGDVSGAGRLIKRGTGTLELAGENSFSGGTEVESGTLALDVNAASSTGEVVMAADTMVKADTTLSLDNVFKLRGPVEFNTQGFDLTLNGRVSNNSVGQLIKTGSGTLTLNGTNDYSGGTIIEQGAIALYGSLASGVEIQATTVLGGGGTVTGDVSNAGIVQPRMNGQRSTLTIMGNYVGQNGTFASTLGGATNDIEADQLAIQGAGNVASGNTSVSVSDPTGVLGKPTVGDGILLVGVTDGATSTTSAFSAPRIASGAYEYRLVRGGEESAQSWYLRASENEPQPPVVVTPEASQREEVALYPALPSLARQYLWSINGTLDDRRGAPDVIGQWDTQPVAWARLIAQRNETKPGNVNDGPGMKVNDWGLQLGADLWRSESDWGQWRAGPVMTIGRSTGGAYNTTGSVQTGDISLNAYSLGFNATVANDQGAYADLLLLGTRLTGVQASSPLGTSINTTGWAFSGSIEGGWRIPLNDKFSVTPQAQIYTTTVNLQDSADAYSQVQMPTETTVLGRLGLKLSYDNIQANGPRTQLWARASVYSTLSGKDASTSFLNTAGTNATTFQSQAPSTWMALEAAVNVQATDSTSVQLGLGYQGTFDNEYRGIYGQVNVRVGF